MWSVTDLRRMEGSFQLLWLLTLITCIQANVIPEIHTGIVHLREDLPKDGFAFQIEATDADGDILTYSIIGPNAIYFNVNENTGEVTIRNPLDREAMTTMPITILVRDSTYTAEKAITIILSDANDNRPIFQDAPYNTEVREDTTIDTDLFTVTAHDADIGVNAVVKYTIVKVIPTGGPVLFSIGESNGKVRLIEKLNYNGLSTFYQLEIKASDSGDLVDGGTAQSSVALAFITVVDVPDLDPQFISLPYTGVVEEHSPVGQSVLTVRAIDRDTGINDRISYNIERSNADGLFEILASDGTVSVKGDIDREALLEINYQVVLVVKATEANPSILGFNANASTEVSITISDINDNKPKFYNCTEDTCVETNVFTGEIFEHSSGALPLSITVKDLDQGTNGRFQLTLAGPDKDAFSVAPTSGFSESQVQIMIRNSLDVDFEKQTSMLLQVIAADPGNTVDCCSTATVTIQIKDTNDNNPSFPQDTYSFTLPEHSPDGTTIDTITADDPDTMDIGNIRYRLLPDSILRYFDVEPTTGRVFVKNSSLIDREVNSVHSVTLQARDTLNNTGTTVLVITLTDINDQTPVINRDSYVDFVSEGADGHLRLTIQATDADDPDLPNSQVQFAIVESDYSENFTITTVPPNTGVLENKGPLDREAIDPLLNGKIELNVTATDMGTPALSTWVKVFINVEDINDNSPMFKEASYHFDVDEAKKGAFVGSVCAEDLDQTRDHNRISFSITDGSFGNFIIRTQQMEDGVYRGNIQVDPDIELDYEGLHKSFSLGVEAADLGQRNASVTAKVTANDVNDERPVFKPAGPLNVLENTTLAGPVGRFQATDADGNHSLIYELVSTACLCQGSLGPCEEEWFNLEHDGEITVNKEFVIDYENCTEVRMEARVVDTYTEQGENSSMNTGVMVIHIDDINDNAPEFIQSNAVFVVVSESASKGTSVAGVTARDRDSGKNKQMEFQVMEVQFHHSTNITTTMGKLFEAVTIQQEDIYLGRIQSLEELDIELKGRYLVTVRATDTGGLYATTVLEIFTVDKTYMVELRFSSPLVEVSNNLAAIKLALTAATKAAVEVVNIREDTSETRAEADTIMEVYFVFPNGTAIASNEVEDMLSDPEHAIILSQFGLNHIGAGALEETETDPVMFILLGLVAGLVITIAVMTTSLVCSRRTYQTKLKAAKAMKSTAMATSDNQTSGPVVPGTNKYTMEGANPVLNLNIDMATDLGFDEDGSNTDRVSLNSLDYNIDMTMSEKDTMPMMMIQEEEEENGEPEYIESLGAALAQRDKKKDRDSPRLTFNNPVFSTTDL